MRASEAVPSASRLSAFGLHLDQNELVRIRTRLTESPSLRFDEENPIVMLGESRLASLLVPSLSTNQTLLAIRHFISLYPACKLFISSDNGRSFAKAATEIKMFNCVQFKKSERSWWSGVSNGSSTVQLLRGAEDSSRESQEP